MITVTQEGTSSTCVTEQVIKPGGPWAWLIQMKAGCAIPWGQEQKGGFFPFDSIDFEACYRLGRW